MNWYDVIKKIYDTFNPVILSQMSSGNTSNSSTSSDKILFKYKGKDVILKNGRYGEYLRYGTKNSRPYILPENRSVNIDTHNDLVLAGVILKNK